MITESRYMQAYVVGWCVAVEVCSNGGVVFQGIWCT